ncbi:MAG: hypothetical protein JXR69_06620 [Candidatus Delongbacteria bacterium]|nr:hypothetical protein [Candidatus Delongbacteria bacterium]
MKLLSSITIILSISLLSTCLFATMNSLTKIYQVWNSLDDCDIHIQEVPFIVSGAVPEAMITSIAKPTKPLQQTTIPVPEINVAVLCNFKITCEYISKGKFDVMIDCSKTFKHQLVENISLVEVSEMLKDCVIKVIEKRGYGLPEKPYIFTIKTYWGENDKKNSTQVVQGAT